MSAFPFAGKRRHYLLRLDEAQPKRYARLHVRSTLQKSTTNFHYLRLFIYLFYCLNVTYKYRQQIFKSRCHSHSSTFTQHVSPSSLSLSQRILKLSRCFTNGYRCHRQAQISRRYSEPNQVMAVEFPVGVQFSGFS